MGHELRTLMNGELAITSLAIETALNEEQEELVKVVHESSEVMLTVITGILDFSKLEMGNFFIEHIPLTLNVWSVNACVASRRAS